MKKSLTILLVMCLIITSSASASAFAFENSEELNLYKNLDKLSKENQAIAKGTILDKKNLMISEQVKGTNVEIYTTSEENTYVGVTDGYVEVIKIDGDVYTINGKKHTITAIERPVTRVNSSSLSSDSVKPMDPNILASGSSYVEVDDPGYGTYTLVYEWWTDVYFNNNLSTFTAAAVSIILANKMGQDIISSACIGLATYLVSSAMAPYTSVAKTHTYKSRHDQLVLTYKFLSYAYAVYQGDDHYLGYDKWWEAWAGL